MPEIAEVETVRNVLKKQILNKKIVDVIVYYEPIIETNVKEFKKNLIGESFIDIKRKGKYLIFECNKYTMVSHLRMEGKYFVLSKEVEKNKHEHVKIVFEDGMSLRYNDVRKFGRIDLVNKGDENLIKGLEKQGEEPMSNKLTKEYLFNKLHNKKVPMKTLLLDQTIISGLGNIYADEVLYSSFINPHRLGNSITLEDCERIINSAREIISKAIEFGGTTIRSYTSSLGVTGHYQDYLQVHKRENLECYNCKTKIVKDKIGGRSTYYCPNCQK
jgi:formamidopyrimidine-DNA glycosylase